MKPGVFVRSQLVCCSLVLLAACSTGGGGAMFFGNNPSNMTASEFTPFVREQLRFSRVRQARDSAESSIQEMFRQQDIEYPAAEVFIRVFKRERALELWARGASSKHFELLHTYQVCALAGLLGPKKTKGDMQVPEGFYFVDLFNPNSSYNLSMRINYPNEHDRAAAKEKSDLGGDIYIHGGCRSDGCLAVTDQAIRQIYWIAVTAHGMGQERIPVHIFPARFSEVKDVRRLKRVYQDGDSMVEFWQSLQPGYQYFQKKHQLPQIDVDSAGQYRITE